MWLQNKLWACVWIGFAVFVAQYIELQHVILHDYVPGKPRYRLNRLFFNIALACFAGWCCGAAYLIVWVKVILTITILSVVSLICFCIAFWPVWGILTLPIVWFIFMGSINLCHFVPL